MLIDVMFIRRQSMITSATRLFVLLLDLLSAEAENEETADGTEVFEIGSDFSTHIHLAKNRISSDFAACAQVEHFTRGVSTGAGSCPFRSHQDVSSPPTLVLCADDIADW